MKGGRIISLFTSFADVRGRKRAGLGEELGKGVGEGAGLNVLSHERGACGRPIVAMDADAREIGRVFLAL